MAGLIVRRVVNLLIHMGEKANGVDSLIDGITEGHDAADFTLNVRRAHTMGQQTFSPLSSDLRPD